jgi:tRNA threonylcarbamoyladenosine biosynthesis protein TsaB
LEQIELEGRSYSSTLIAGVGELLANNDAQLNQVAGIVAVNGPGSFTGVRVGLSAVKGLAEPAQIPVVAVSRLEVLSAKTGKGAAALDAHRGEIFLRLGGVGLDGTALDSREVLAGEAEVHGMAAASSIAVCDDAAQGLLGSAWPSTELVRASAPTAADALRLCAERFRRGRFVDLVVLDGHYLRRSDAEIFGEVAVQRG